MSNREEKLLRMVLVLEDLDASGRIWDHDNDLTWSDVAEALLDAIEQPSIPTTC